MSVPLYTYPCLTPSATGDLLLLGISPANEGTLNVHKVDLSNINSPLTYPYATQINTLEWTSKAPTACFPYPGNAASVALFAQFGSLTRFANVRGAGNIEGAINFPSTSFQSPKQFSFVASTGTFDFFHVYTNKTFPTTSSAWTGARFNGTDSLYSFQSYYTSQVPPGLPMISLGTFTPGSTSGYNVFFDSVGAGTIYSTVANTQPILANLNTNLVTLAKGQGVDMGGVKLSENAIPVTMDSVGYLLDKASDGTTVVYSINPSQSAKLMAVSTSSDVPLFSTVQSATAVGSKIVVYGVSNSSSVFFNSFDTSAGTWTGPNLIKPAKPESKGSSMGAIVGGIVGGLVVIALIAFFVIRKRRNRNKPTTVPAPTTNYQDPTKFENAATPPPAVPPTQQVYPLPQQHLQQQQQHQQGVYQQQQQQPTYDPHQAQLPPTSHYPMPQPSPAIYQQQQHFDPNVSQQQQHYDPNLPQQHQQQQQQQPYAYTPPTFIPQEQQQQQHLSTAPVIFQPQSPSGSSPTYTQAVYSPSINASEYPQTPVTPASQTAYPTPEYQHQHQHQHQYQHDKSQAVPSVPMPSNPQYVGSGVMATSTAASRPSNPQYVPQAGNEYTQ